MRVAISTDEDGALPRSVLAELQARGDEVMPFGVLAGGEGEWAEVSAAAARAVASGEADAAVVVCWTGTGASIAANKVPGVRAALCADADTARMSRRYNHANVLALSMRSTTEAMGGEIVRAFLEAPWGDDAFDHRNVAALESRADPSHD